MGTHIMSVGIKLVMTYGLILQGSKAKASAKKRKKAQKCATLFFVVIFFVLINDGIWFAYSFKA